MMRLGVIDYVAFSRVCKSWRSLTLCNKNKFIVSRPPMSISISYEKECHLVDYEGRKLKINLPNSAAGRFCIGVTCGYLIFRGENPLDFWLVNPISRHELHFPFPFPATGCQFQIFKLGATLVFSHSISGWVFVVYSKLHDEIWFCIVGKREWACVSTIFPIFHLQAFKGKIYIIDRNNRVGEVRLCPTPKVTLLEIKNIPKLTDTFPRFVSSVENLYAMDLALLYPHKKIYELNLSKMEWVSLDKAGEKYALFFSGNGNAIRAEMWADHKSNYKRYAVNYARCCRELDTTGEGRILLVDMWYLFHDCLDVA